MRLLLLLSAAAGLSPADRRMVCVYKEVHVAASAEGPPKQEISVTDLTPHVSAFLAETGLEDGCVNVISRHTTTAVTINESEARLLRDVRRWLLALAPPDGRSEIGERRPGSPEVRYEHNDISMRPESDAERQRCLDNGWDVSDAATLEEWRAQEPINAHAHLAAMLVGSSETIPVANGATVLGQWQSVMLVDLDGPRARTVGLQVIGFA
mmetsp:Transcript_1838/g.5496  ORF Transcript_1838/g.5496 Transcript_1838/m.5496 type:complete len:210 (+) Transcript_1838:55-684(+)